MSEARLLLQSPAILVQHVPTGLQCHCRALGEGVMTDVALVTFITEFVAVALPALLALGAYLAMLAYATASALLAPGAPSSMLTEATASALLAL